MEGYVHSYETFATLDGGGIRGMVFLSGCKYRCAYCHNPDTWQTQGTKTTSDEVVKKLSSYKNYYKNGGITISGGEPLLQSEFTLELVKGFRQNGLHVAIDTSACVIPSNVKEILSQVNLVILDLKFYDEKGYNEYCKGSIQTVTDMIDLVNEMGVEVLLRTVVVPTINDKKSDMDRYVEIAKTVKNLKKYELLGYHTLGVDKYAKLGLSYSLDKVPSMDKDLLSDLQKYVDGKLNE